MTMRGALLLFCFTAWGSLPWVYGADAVASPSVPSSPPGVQEPRGNLPIYRHWENFSVGDGLPDNKVFAICVEDDRVWVGTENGLGLYEKGAWRIYRPADGLAHRVVMSLAVDRKTGDLWVATLGGLNRFSAGRFDTFTQLNSGLSNDVVYAVAIQDEFVWAATAAGLSRLNTRTGEWALFNERNTPMHEIWCYNLAVNDGKVYVAVWGGGVLEYDVATGRWKDYRDPDGEMEIVLFRDSGLIHDVVASVSYEKKILWAATYFGVSRYDGRHWQGFLEKDSGLASNFVNFIKARGDAVWMCTDKGLNYFDGKTWITYRRKAEGSEGEVKILTTANTTSLTTPSGPANNYILAIDFQGDDIWVGTAKGLSRGIRTREEKLGEDTRRSR